MSHEIRTPLNAIVGFSTLLVSEQAELTPEEIEEYAAIIEKNGELLMLLISDILDLSKIESNTMEFNICTFSLNEMLIDIARMQRLNVKPGVKLMIDLPEEDMKVTADPARLGQVMNNLINNAVKFTTKGNIQIGYHRAGEGVVELFVEDNGKGMSEEVLCHIFERFYKGDSFVQLLAPPHDGSGCAPASHAPSSIPGAELPTSGVHIGSDCEYRVHGYKMQ